MPQTKNNNSAIEISSEDVFKRDKKDAVHDGLKIGLSVLPLAGEIFELLVEAPASKRRDDFLRSVYERLRKLEDEREDFSIEDLAENEKFASTVIQATQAAIRTSSEVKRRALRNCVLNAALPKSPDENRQATFVRLCDELTEFHINILKLFDGGRRIPSLNLDDGAWRMNIALDELGKLVEVTYPEYRGQFNFYVQVIDDLHKRGLISNLIPAKDMLARIHNEPTQTPFAREFLAFLKSPLNED